MSATLVRPTDVSVTFASLALYHRERAEMCADLRDEADTANARVSHENRRRWHLRAAELCEKRP